MEVFTSQQLNYISLKCSRCNWSDTGDKAIVIDFYGLSEVKEVHCPQCDAQLAALRNDDDTGGESADQVNFQIG